MSGELGDQVAIVCTAPDGWDWLEQGEPRGCWWWQYDGAHAGPFDTRAEAFADAERAFPAGSVGIG